MGIPMPSCIVLGWESSAAGKPPGQIISEKVPSAAGMKPTGMSARNPTVSRTSRMSRGDAARRDGLAMSGPEKAICREQPMIFSAGKLRPCPIPDSDQDTTRGFLLLVST